MPCTVESWLKGAERDQNKEGNKEGLAQPSLSLCIIHNDPHALISQEMELGSQLVYRREMDLTQF